MSISQFAAHDNFISLSLYLTGHILIGLQNELQFSDNVEHQTPESKKSDLGFFEFVHNVRKRGKALLPALIELLAT